MSVRGIIWSGVLSSKVAAALWFFIFPPVWLMSLASVRLPYVRTKKLYGSSAFLSFFNDQMRSRQCGHLEPWLTAKHFAKRVPSQGLSLNLVMWTRQFWGHRCTELGFPPCLFFLLFFFSTSPHFFIPTPPFPFCHHPLHPTAPLPCQSSGISVEDMRGNCSWRRGNDMGNGRGHTGTCQGESRVERRRELIIHERELLCSHLCE